MNRRLGDNRGSTSVELVILAPLIGILLGCVVLVGRVQIGRADLEGAARSAARELSIARDPYAALSGVQEGLEATLRVGSPSCRSLTFAPVIRATEVSVTIACSVDLQGAAVLPVPATLTLTASATEVVDIYREIGS